jgi:hypothetical protein
MEKITRSELLNTTVLSSKARIWAYNLDKQPGDEDASWDFAMGGNF